jgi:hypothetical protein
MSESKGAHPAWLVLAVLLFGGVMLWGYLDQNHYFYHVKLSHISSSTWAAQTTKECFSWNVTTDKPALDCDAGHSELQQDVRVKFYGDTRIDLQPDTLRLRWQCLKVDASTTPISCHISP